MGDALDIMQVAGLGAAALVTEMAKSTWESVRGGVARLFRRGGEESAEQELRLVDAARQRLVDSAESERGTVEERLRGELVIQLAAFLQKHPDAAQELRDLVGQFRGDGGRDGASTSVHHNSHSQVVISAGDINASGGFHYRAPEQSR
ncbi:hypothetical protein F9278_20090 [Streptomyces phaeolivaceus]|uniref:Uncharacterized protein n=1 Tax=Streptomyces phaeolivaceus TaxID=2653200 RepID=A0A5P8K5Q7_9ACTN|nr:hypothetical protein [Streptomyces phaeolivaceus]QFQ98132.1 hypothetical protein F9278_20090 [Streptomyces phaeolivaceus]